MTELFLTILNMSISAGWIVLAVLVLRLLLKKAPRWITVLLWAVVAIRLILPVTVESVMSLIPSAETVSRSIMLEQTPEIYTGISYFNNAVNPVISETNVEVTPEKSVNILHVLTPIFTGAWLVGMGAMLVYTAISYYRVRKMIGTAVRLRDNIYQSETVVSPFVLGLVKPKIYLPFAINEQDMDHVLAHEQAHIRRRDYLWKPLGFLLLTVHWFNPLLWLGYILLCRDIELACDEKVVRGLDREQRAGYSQALLTCSVNRRVIAACPLAFGEVSVKKRVKSVLNYKKPAFWIIIVAVLALIITAVCFLTNPPTEAEPQVPSTDSAQGTTQVITDIQEDAWFDPVIDAAAFDIDGDGKEENCTLGYGPTSGLFTVILRVQEDGKNEYFNIFQLEHGNLSFVQTDSGWRLRLMPSLGDQMVIDYSFSVRDGNIVLTVDGQEAAYWGEQGIYSFWSGIQMEEDGTVSSAISYPSYLKVYEATPAEQVVENYDTGEFVIIKTHYRMEDGTWAVDGYTYKYRLEVTGRMHASEKSCTYIILSNRESITFDEAWKASGYSSNLNDYFVPGEAVIVGNRLF